MHVLTLAVLFVLSGVVVPLLIELISLNGGCPQSTLIIALPSCVGMSLSILTNWKSVNMGVINWKIVLTIACIDMVAQILNFNGLVYAGSAIYTVVYSSVTVYIAVFSYMILNRKLLIGQWFGILVVMLGLSIVAIGSHSDGEDVSLGITLILVGSGLHSITYICSEYLLVVADDPVSPEMLCSLLGGIGALINIFWQLVYTMPRFQSLVVAEVVAHDGSVAVILASYLAIVVASMVHSICFFHLLGAIGSTSTAVMKGTQSVAVFVASHFAYCAAQRSQCFTLWKAVSLVVVLLGVGIYSHHPSQHVARRSSCDTLSAMSALLAADAGRGKMLLNPYLPVRDGGDGSHSYCEEGAGGAVAGNHLGSSNPLLATRYYHSECSSFETVDMSSELNAVQMTENRTDSYRNV